jgi:hypothetical protein
MIPITRFVKISNFVNLLRIERFPDNAPNFTPKDLPFFYCHNIQVLAEPPVVSVSVVLV